MHASRWKINMNNIIKTIQTMEYEREFVYYRFPEKTARIAGWFLFEAYKAKKDLEWEFLRNRYFTPIDAFNYSFIDYDKWLVKNQKNRISADTKNVLPRKHFNLGMISSESSMIILLKLLSEKNKYKKVKTYKNINTSYSKDIFLELFWSLFPLTILLFLIGPSLGLLYSSTLLNVNNFYKPDITIKIVGAMWYWIYQYPSTLTNSYDFGVFDSYLISNLTLNSTKTLKVTNLSIYRNLAVDEILTLPTFKKVRLLITSQDTIHSWTVPSLAIKLDACPGRLNQIYLQILREGFFFGQCSELCGVNHGFMPINVRSYHHE